MWLPDAAASGWYTVLSARGERNGDCSCFTFTERRTVGRLTLSSDRGTGAALPRRPLEQRCFTNLNLDRAAWVDYVHVRT